MSAPSGGVWDKLGNSYEAVWTVDRMIDVFLGRYVSITPEPFGEEAIGVEFVLSTHGGTPEYHSVKRQTQKPDWSVAALCEANPSTGRSILGDLFNKLIAEPDAKLVFVSSTGANHLRELAERADHQSTYQSLRDSLSQTLQPQLTERLLPLCAHDEDRTLASLKALEVIPRAHAELTRSVEQRIDLHFYRKDDETLDAGDLRRRLHEFAMNHLGETLTTDRIRAHLDESGYGNRDWRSDPHVLDRVAKVNLRYRSVVETELINGVQLSRTATDQVATHLNEPNSNGVLLVAPGGFGKSCVLSQSVDQLLSDDTPTIVIRMDSIRPCSTSKQLGQQMDLPASPAVVLAGIADNTSSVLVIDQLDAMSTVSGRNIQLWEVFDEIRREVAAYPNMQLLLACRGFDLEHDPRLRTLDGEAANFEKVHLETLTRDEIDESVRASGVGSLSLSDEQYEILEVPFHLLLFLEGEPTAEFTSIGELFDRYWKRKRSNLDAKLGRACRWNQVIDALTRRMSDDQLLFAPKAVVEEADAESDAEGMVSEHVLIEDGSSYRFFHESFFDYAYARRFSASGATLLSLLAASEQHLFRRSQVRQILAYRRVNDRRKYLTDLKDVLASPDVRFHLKRMIASGFSEVKHPGQDEWQLVEPYLFDHPLSRHFLRAMRGHAGWFDLLSTLGVFEEWMTNE